MGRSATQSDSGSDESPSIASTPSGRIAFFTYPGRGTGSRRSSMPATIGGRREEGEDVFEPRLKRPCSSSLGHARVPDGELSSGCVTSRLLTRLHRERWPGFDSNTTCCPLNLFSHGHLGLCRILTFSPRLPAHHPLPRPSAWRACSAPTISSLCQSKLAAWHET